MSNDGSYVAFGIAAKSFPPDSGSLRRCWWAFQWGQHYGCLNTTSLHMMERSEARPLPGQVPFGARSGASVSQALAIPLFQQGQREVVVGVENVKTCISVSQRKTDETVSAGLLLIFCQSQLTTAKHATRPARPQFEFAAIKLDTSSSQGRNNIGVLPGGRPGKQRLGSVHDPLRLQRSGLPNFWRSLVDEHGEL
jgi:hypothetical protein